MWNEQFQSIFTMIMMAVMLRTSYELTLTKLNKGTYLIERASKPTNITPQQKEWAEKSVQQYAAAQEKKWRNWNEAMFEAGK